MGERQLTISLLIIFAEYVSPLLSLMLAIQTTHTTPTQLVIKWCCSSKLSLSAALVLFSRCDFSGSAHFEHRVLQRSFFTGFLISNTTCIWNGFLYAALLKLLEISAWCMRLPVHSALKKKNHTPGYIFAQKWPVRCLFFSLSFFLSSTFLKWMFFPPPRRPLAHISSALFVLFGAINEAVYNSAIFPQL